ncbi:hypothetical protein KC19_10G059400 [Ceratodon purpureus]|uniref:Uncharacterized protein n=1 Tax=Ceratodon purpureus TaxID=3225 RepID=A0A8T0GM92_CERPU|nr:hypothetical protein KC19_10G059400 [Ceratodon purpureus]
MNKLALKKVVDWKDRTERVAAAICELEVTRPVEDVLEGWPEQMNSEDLSVVLGNVGEDWRRAQGLRTCKRTPGCTPAPMDEKASWAPDQNPGHQGSKTKGSNT